VAETEGGREKGGKRKELRRERVGEKEKEREKTKKKKNNESQESGRRMRDLV